MGSSLLSKPSMIWLQSGSEAKPNHWQVFTICLYPSSQRSKFESEWSTQTLLQGEARSLTPNTGHSDFALCPTRLLAISGPVREALGWPELALCKKTCFRKRSPASAEEPREQARFASGFGPDADTREAYLTSSNAEVGAIRYPAARSRASRGLLDR